MNEEFPWEGEPDEHSFEHFGFQCELKRGPVGAWCGYVLLPESHPLHGMNKETSIVGSVSGLKSVVEAGCILHLDRERDTLIYSFDVHGGISFSKEWPFNKSLWAIGFDCSHCDDRTSKSPPGDTRAYRTMEYAISETKKLAEQLAGFWGYDSIKITGMSSSKC